MHKPNAIFFDLDETLIENKISVPDLFASMYFEFEGELGSGNKDVFFGELRPRIGKLWGTMFMSDASPESQLTKAFADSIDALGVHSSKEASKLGKDMFDRFCDRSSKNTVLHEDAVETLEALREAGFITGIITNGIEQLQLGKIQVLELERHVDHVVVSAQARAHKPHKQVFELALNRAGVQPEKAWQIGDHATNDVAGAIRAGMSGVFYDPQGSRRATAFDELEEVPTHTISALSEVLHLVA